MQTKTTFVAALVVPLLLLACDRAEQSPTAEVPSQERQAMTPETSPDKTLERSPPAAGQPAPLSEPATTAPLPEKSPSAIPPNETRKAY